MQISGLLLLAAVLGGSGACGGEGHNASPDSLGATPQSGGSGSEAGSASGSERSVPGAGERSGSEVTASEPTAAGNHLLPVAPSARRPLPDLVLDAAYLVDSTRFDTQRIEDPCALEQRCATGLGERRVLRFGSRMGNLGEADFVLGVPEQANPLWTLDACSNRFSLSGFARYELRAADSGEQVLLGTKNEFCMTDAEEWIPGSGEQCQTYSCTRQGIRPGCADNYGTDLPCQWLDVTDVAPGVYELRVTVNAERTVEELDYDNDSVQLRVRIDPNGGSIER